jgi:hypothetical protein
VIQNLIGLPTWNRLRISKRRVLVLDFGPILSGQPLSGLSDSQIWSNIIIFFDPYQSFQNWGPDAPWYVQIRPIQIWFFRHTCHSFCAPNKHKRGGRLSPAPLSSHPPLIISAPTQSSIYPFAVQHSASKPGNSSMRWTGKHQNSTNPLVLSLDRTACNLKSLLLCCLPCPTLGPQASACTHKRHWHLRKYPCLDEQQYCSIAWLCHTQGLNCNWIQPLAPSHTLSHSGLYLPLFLQVYFVLLRLIPLELVPNIICTSTALPNNLSPLRTVLR